MNNALIAYRKLLNLKQSELSKIIGISSTSYSKKETGKIPFTQVEMILITKILKEHIPEITMDDIFFNQTVNKLVTLKHLV